MKQRYFLKSFVPLRSLREIKKGFSQSTPRAQRSKDIF
jgi:hypothetical protein